MRSIGFRLRLGLFFVATLVVVQLVTAALVYQVTRHTLVREGQQQLSTNAQAFLAQMDDISARVADNVEVLSLDYALRSAIAERDRGTVLSVLRNHGRRVGASRMLLIDPDGTVEIGTDGSKPALKRFPFPGLIKSAYARRTAAVVALDGKAFWTVVVPIYAPQPVGLVVVNVPLNDQLLAHIQHLSGLPRNIELAVQPKPGHWLMVASGDGRSALVDHLNTMQAGLPWTPLLTTVAGREYIVLAQRLEQPDNSPPVVAILGYSLDDALHSFRSIATAGVTLLAIGLAFGLLATWLTARNVSRPIEMLAAAVRRIEAGDYRAPPRLNRHDEIGQLANAFGTMTQAVRQREERIRHQSVHDVVTGLPTRVAAEAEIDRRLAAAPEPAGALLMIGLTRMPDIVKTLGHALSDRLMRDAAECIAAVAEGAYLARATDTQLMLVLDDTGKPEVIAVALRIMDALNVPYQEAEIAIDRLPSIGIAMIDASGARASVLLRHAEVAQFSASGSAGGVNFYQPATDPHLPERLSLMGDLRDALDHDQILLYYQPKLALAEQHIDSCEALVRWNHPRLGWLPPDTFVAMAEDTGNIQRLTRWVLNSALMQARSWLDRGLSLKVAVNLSARDLEDIDLPSRIRSLLAAHGVPASLLTVEVTERAVIGERDQAIQILRRLAEQGVGIAIDDFGVGQSTFAYLRHLPISELKIDRMFITQLATESSDQIIVGSLIELSHRLGYRVTAEGVEDQGALDFLVSAGCDHAQGFFISCPVSADVLETSMLEREADSNA